MELDLNSLKYLPTAIGVGIGAGVGGAVMVTASDMILVLCLFVQKLG